MTKNIRIVHIGFGKTATTSLQRKVFEKLRAIGSISYNPSEVRKQLEHFRRGDASTIKSLQSYFNENSDIVISLEALLGWDPGVWRERLEMNKKVFPADTSILITIRDPESYLRSAYQQTVAQGNVIAEGAFFLKEEDYARVRQMRRPIAGEIFSVDDLDYKGIINAYSECFSQVCVVPISRIANLNYLQKLGIKLEHHKLRQLSEDMRASDFHNRSFSKLAMRITHWRESWLNVLGLQSRFTVLTSYPFSLTLPQKLRQRSILQRAAGRLPTWRYLVTGIFDRVVPYSAYELEPETPRGRYFHANMEVYNKISSLESGFLFLENGKVLA